MNNGIIIGTGKIGLDLYIKLKKAKIFNKIFIFNTNKNSEGAKYCRKKIFLFRHRYFRCKKNYKFSVIFDCTSAKSNLLITKSLKIT